MTDRQIVAGAVSELNWIYWIFPTVFLVGLFVEYLLYRMGEIAPISALAITVFWALFAYVVQTAVLVRALRLLDRALRT